jgi:hypothetical protein
MRSVLRLLAAAVCGLVANASTAIEQPSASVGRGGRERCSAVAFDYLVLFNPDSVVAVVDQIAPGRGREFTNLWRTRQFEYCWLRSITDRYVDFEAVTNDALVYTANALLELEKREIVFAAFGGWDAAGAKSFGYPTVWVNRLKQPFEELGLHPDRTVTDLNGLLDFVLKQER